MAQDQEQKSCVPDPPFADPFCRIPAGWGRWLVDNCGMGVSTAELYMQLARHREKIEVEIERVGELSLRAARRFIAKPRGHNIIKAQALENQSRRDG